MKNFIKISLVVASLILMATGAFANDFLLKTNTENQKTISILINETQDVKLSLSDLDEEVIYEQQIQTKQATTKTYNLAALPDGDYKLKLEVGSKTTTYKIAIKKNKAVISEPVIAEIIKPVLTKDKEMITLDLGNTYKGEVEVQVYNEYNEELYNQKFEDQSKLIKKFDTSKTYSKQLTFIVKSNDQEFIKTIETR
jgi:hypothetical protein